MSLMINWINPTLAAGVAAIVMLLAGCNHEPIVDEVTNPGGTPDVIYFIRASESRDIDSAALPGTLSLDADGCLRVVGIHNQSEVPSVIWPHEYSLRVAADGRIEILDAEDRVETWIGDQITLEGSMNPDTVDDNLGECNGPFWNAGPGVSELRPTPTFIDTPVPEEMRFATPVGSCYEQYACLDP